MPPPCSRSPGRGGAASLAALLPAALAPAALTCVPRRAPGKSWSAFSPRLAGDKKLLKPRVRNLRRHRNLLRTPSRAAGARLLLCERTAPVSICPVQTPRQLPSRGSSAAPPGGNRPAALLPWGPRPRDAAPAPGLPPPCRGSHLRGAVLRSAGGSEGIRHPWCCGSSALHPEMQLGSGAQPLSGVCAGNQDYVAALLPSALWERSRAAPGGAARTAGVLCPLRGGRNSALIGDGAARSCRLSTGLPAPATAVPVPSGKVVSP